MAVFGGLRRGSVQRQILDEFPSGLGFGSKVSPACLPCLPALTVSPLNGTRYWSRLTVTSTVWRGQRPALRPTRSPRT